MADTPTPSQYTRDELLTSLNTLAAKLGRSPTAAECNTDAETPSCQSYIRQFGSWNAALAAAGLAQRHNNVKISREDLLDSLRELADEVGRSPTIAECNASAQTAAADTYRARFGSWSDALSAAGLATRTPTGTIPREDLLESLRELAAELGRPPMVTECDAAPETASVSTYQNRFGSWVGALHAAGLDPSNASRANSNSISREELLRDLRQLAAILGRAPAVSECNSHPSMASAGTYQYRFGTWTDALCAADCDPDTVRIDSRSKLIADLRDLVEMLDAVPTEEKMADVAPFTLHTYEVAFGSWEAAIEAVQLHEQE